MFLRIAAAAMLLLLPLCGYGSIIISDRYEQIDAETDITILKSILSRYPEDLKTLKRLIDLTFTLEYFDQTEKYCDQYLAIKKNSEPAYLKIIAAASLGKFKTAADLIEPFISSYGGELSSRDITLLKYRETLYRKSAVTRGYPLNAVKTSWGTGSLIKTVLQRDSLYSGYSFKEHQHSLIKINGDSAADAGNYPDYLSGFTAESITSVSLSDDGREVLASSHSGDTSSIYIRKYSPDKKKWSAWEKPGGLNPGKWNHYPNFINSNAVLFSSSDGSDYDLFIAQRNENGEWSRAEKLQGINTPLDEISVWLHPDGETLYFSSNGYEGMGGFDIYGARLIQKGNTYEVSNIKNIVSANTFRNEKYPLFVTPSGSEAYFNFTEGENHNVYICRENNIKPESVFFYDADITDDSTGNPVNGVSAVYKSSGAEFRLSRPVYSDGFTGTILRRNMKYTLTLSAPGYEQFSKTISFTGKEDLVKEKIRLKRKSEKPAVQSFTTLITGLKLINCEESKVLPVKELLESKIGVLSDGVNRGGIISSLTICGNISCASADGKTVNADFVVFGTLFKTEQSAMKTLGKSGEDQYIAQRVTGAKYILELKLLHTATGKIVVSIKKTTGNPDSLKNITNEFIRKTESFYQEK